jgi:lysozyme
LSTDSLFPEVKAVIRKNRVALSVVGPVVLSLACTSPQPAVAPSEPAPRAEARAEGTAQPAPAPAPEPAAVEVAAAPASAPSQPAEVVQASALAKPAAAAEPAVEVVPAKKTRLQGVDVSHYQPTVDWDAVKSTASFVFIKATDSTNGVDPRFSSHWSGAKKAGIPRGAYHFFHPKRDVKAQVANFVKHVSADPGELPVVVDVEEFKDEYLNSDCETLTGLVKEFTQGVEKALGYKPIIYTNHETWKTSFCGHPHFLDYPLWLAQYTAHPTEPKMPEGWKQWHFWQYTESGKVQGIPGQVDQSYFNGSVEELKALLKAKK